MNLTQIDFNKPAEQWSGELYDLLVAVAREVNSLSSQMDDVNAKLEQVDKRFAKIGKEI